MEDVILLSLLNCTSVHAVPSDATALSRPTLCSLRTSGAPSTIIIFPASLALAARSIPNKAVPLVYTSDVLELIYLGALGLSPI